MIQRIKKYVEDNRMIEPNDYVVAGVSGGADSVCLLLMLIEIQKDIPFKLHVVHVNHGIRAEAHEDAEYVLSLCQKYDIEFTLVEEDVESIARREHISSEEAGRQVRYQAFARELEKSNALDRGKIAIAHNKNDCCETFLFNLFRGSNLKGLSGIRPVRDNIIRPLLCVERKEIEDYLYQNNIAFCIDRTNLEDNYTRNRIRHHILPVADEQICQGAVSHIKDASDAIAQAYDLIEDLVNEGYDRCVLKQEDRYIVNVNDLLQLHPTIQTYCVHRVVSEAAGSSKDIEAIHIRQVMELKDKQSGRMVNLPYHLIAKREYDNIVVLKGKEKIEAANFELKLDGEMREELEKGKSIILNLPDSKQIRLKIQSSDDIDCKNIEQNPYTKLLDYDKIKGDIVVRNRKAGDFLTINSLDQRKTLKSFFIDQKVSKELRDKLLLVADEDHIMWLIGYRISNYYKVELQTKRVLVLEFIGGNQHG